MISKIILLLILIPGPPPVVVKAQTDIEICFHRNAYSRRYGAEREIVQHLKSLESYGFKSILLADTDGWGETNKVTVYYGNHVRREIYVDLPTQKEWDWLLSGNEAIRDELDCPYDEYTPPLLY